MRDLDDIGEEMTSIRVDEEVPLARIKDAYVAQPEDDYAFKLRCETSGGEVFSRKFQMPTEWEPMRSNTVLLLEYIDLHPSDLSDLSASTDKTYEIPIRRDGIGVQIDYQQMESEVFDVGE